jgi:mevalonate kinase
MEFRALLLYDHQTRPKYEDCLRGIVDRLGGHLDVVDAAHDVFEGDTLTMFEALTLRAHVIMIDVTTANTNVGIEIGKCMLYHDRRIVVFRITGSPIPHYLKNFPCFELDPSRQSDTEPNSRLGHEIERIGMRCTCLTPTPCSCGPVDLEAAKNLGPDRTIVRAPAAAFLFGEYAVMAGHPALYLPLPLYVYAGIRTAGKDTIVSYLQKPGTLERNPVRVPLDFESQLLLRDAIKSVAPSAPPLEIVVWTQAPTMCGLGTSSALSACIALYLHSKGYITPELDADAGEPLSNRNLLIGQKGIAPLFRTAWKLDVAFHGLKGSGAGSFVSVAGTSGPNPVLFFSAARKMWPGDIGEFGLQLGKNMAEAHMAIDSIPCWGFRLKPGHGRQTFKNSHFALVYTGQPKSTNFAIDKLAEMGRYFLESPEMIQQIVQAMSVPPSTLRHELHSRRSSSYMDLLARSMTPDANRTAISKEHSDVSLDTLLAAYGAATMVGINSYWSEGDSSYLALMESCQCLLEVIGKTSIPRDRGAFPTMEPHCLAKEINSASGEDGKRLFGAKVTGGGMGGDLIVSSRIEDAQEFEVQLKNCLNKAIARCHPRKDDEFAAVHFSSSWMKHFPGGYEVHGATIV